MSLNKLSAVTDIRRDTLVEYDRGAAVTIKTENIEILAKFFNIADFNQLFEYIPEPKPKPKK